MPDKLYIYLQLGLNPIEQDIYFQLRYNCDKDDLVLTAETLEGVELMFKKWRLAVEWRVDSR